jgi:hypothetical protein
MSGDLKQFIETRQLECREAYQALLNMGAWEGWYKTLSSLYPDNAHFVFELLQNAEDANATKVKFELLDGMLTFRHDGTRDFNKDDVYAITNVGDSKKGEEANKIGKFGVGFKSVFAYTTSPKIYSKSVSFEIKHLFIPSLIDPEPIRGGYTTAFNFPFDREDKSRNDAFNEIKALFDELSDNVLLFLSNIQAIEWQIKDSNSHQITKESNQEIIEINNTQKGISHWLVFTNQFEFDGKDKPLTLSVAYSYNKKKKEIEPIRGDVSIFFPAKKETSKLKFHIDAPFSSTVARDSIVESSENDQIMEDIANLCCQSVHKIKDQGLLSMSFFEVIPNRDDELDEFYLPIFDKLVEEFEWNEHNLIPLENGSFGCLMSAMYSSRAVKDTFNDEDLSKLFDYVFEGFAKNPLINSRSHKFLSELNGLQEYEDLEIFNEFYEIMGTLTNTNFAFERKWSRENDDYSDLNLILRRREWLESRANEDLQKLYAFLGDVIDQNAGPINSSISGKSDNFDNFNHVIKLSDESFNYSDYNVYFSTSSEALGGQFKYVHPETYSYGKKKSQQQKARSFLEKIGVQDVDDSTHIGLMFDEYKFTSQPEHLKDINRLVDWYVEEQKNNSDNEEILKKLGILHKSFVFTDNHKLVMPIDVYIDEPFVSSGLRYIEPVMTRQRLHAMYQNLNNSSKFIELLIHLYAKASLEVVWEQLTSSNPHYIGMRRKWHQEGGEKETGTRIREDWNIPGLRNILEIEENKFEISKLLLNAINNAKKEQFTAKFRGSKAYETQLNDSSLIYHLKDNEWIPDADQNFHKPCDISEETIHKDFVINNDNKWLYAVEFGKNILNQKAEYQEKKDVLAEFGIPIDFAEELKREGISIEEVIEASKKIKSQKLAASMQSNSGKGDTSRVTNLEGSDSIITDPKKHQKNIETENKDVIEGTTIVTRNNNQQNLEQLNKIKKYLYSEYIGHCQVCGDTFKGNNNINIFMMYSLNRSNKGAHLKSDVNRKGNSLSLCPKHHRIFQLGLQSFSFIDKLDYSELSFASIEDSFEFRSDVGKGEEREFDCFYNRPEESSFERDVFMLPIMLFSKRFYLKFTQDHIQQFIEVWNNN